ncbi:MAG: permease [Bdellovibrio sp. CG10_big_fil_rev_8_21_14_0_10_47_8]|nr:MAG: permease [Bdellovibrio sp. CG10_big_fil_rev_8_21_14_0_10_47_8]
MLVAWIASLLMGATLGLLGAGGSILTVPILVYLLHLPGSVATTQSLLIVGAVALLGSWRNSRKKEIQWKQGFLFLIPGLIGVFFARAWILPRIPSSFSIGPWSVSKDAAFLIIFSVVMFLAALSMLKKKKSDKPVHSAEAMASALGIGILTGIIGVGGGFLITPVLHRAFSLPIKKAIATSLFVIAVQSLGGWFITLFKDPALATQSMSLVIPVLSISLIGMFSGEWLKNKVPEKQLKFLFAGFVLFISCSMLYLEFKKMGGNP